MKRIKYFSLIVATAVLSMSFTPDNKTADSKASIIKTATDAYIYGLSLVFTDITRLAAAVSSNVYSHSRKFPDHTSRLVVRPNNDTNYSSAFLDLGDDAVVLTIPDTKDRYYVLPLMDAWTNVFKSFGKRTTGTKAQTYVITGPHWKGIIPKGLAEVKSPTDLVWIIGRIQVNNPEDQANFVSKLQDEFKITLLSQWGKQNVSTPKSAKQYEVVATAVASVQRHEKTVVQAVKNLTIEDYFNYINQLLIKNPGLSADSSVLRKFAAIGIKPGTHFSIQDFDQDVQDSLKLIPQRVFTQLDQVKGFLKSKSNDKPDLTIGNYGVDYTKRAIVAYVGLGALNAEEAVYPGYTVDSENHNLTGNNKYSIHFEKGKLPPARAFWSLTLYDKDGYLAENAIRRYAIGDRNALKFNKDGSLDLYIQNANPGSDKENNWLPAPADEFSLALRIYWPTEDYLHKDGAWIKPALQKVQ
jgi:hypothetical protein